MDLGGGESMSARELRKRLGELEDEMEELRDRLDSLLNPGVDDEDCDSE